MSYALDGIPFDTMNSPVEGRRRFKTETMSRQDVEIFNGCKFHLYSEHSLAAGISVNALAFKTPTDKDVVLSNITTDCSGGDTELLIYEGATYSNGTVVTPLQINRMLTDVSVSTTVTLPTVSSVGTVINKFKMYGSATGVATKTIASTADASFHPLKRNTVYLLVLRNASSDASKCFCKLQWYELTI